jgi:integrase
MIIKFLRPICDLKNWRLINMPKITKRLVETIKPENKDVIIRDSELKGFLCKVTPKGKRVYLLYYRTKDGRERRPVIGTHGNITCDQARVMAMNWLAEVSKGNDPSLNKRLEKTDITIIELTERYLKEYAIAHKKPLSIKRDKVLFKYHIIPYLGNIKVKILTAQDISNLHYKMRSLATSANRCIALLSKMLNLAEEWGLRADAGTLCKHIKKYPENKRDRFLSMEEIEKLFQILKDCDLTRTELPTSMTAIKLLLLTGCRLSEILTLKLDYIDLKSHRMNLPDSKTGKKTVYISPYVIEILEALPQKENNPYVIYGLKEGSHLVNLQKAWHRIRKKAGLEDVRLHDLRHSFASIGVSNGLSLPVIGALLGHSQVQTTARYAHLIGDPLIEAASLIGEKIKAVVK